MTLYSFRNTLVSALTWSMLGLGVAAVFPFVLLWRIIGWPFDRMNYYGGLLFRAVSRWTVLWTPRWKMEVRGTPPPDPRHPYVVVSNHESFADIILLSHLPWEMKWLSKIEIMLIPVMGWIMWLVRDVGVKRGRAVSARAAMQDCRKRLANRVSVMIFPEGTRSPHAEMLPFRDGAFRLAIDAGVPILPLALYGTRNAIAKHDWRIGATHAVVQILEPIPSSNTTVAELKQQVRARIQVARDALREELSSGARA